MSNLTPGWLVVLLLTALGCSEPSLFAQAVEARQRATNLELQFVRAVAASQRAVMADDPRASASAQEEAEALRARVVRDGHELRQLLAHAEFEPELALLGRFQSNFTAYQLLDRDILAHEKSNAQAHGGHSLALIPNDKRTLTAACEQGLHSLKMAIAKRIAPVDR